MKPWRTDSDPKLGTSTPNRFLVDLRDGLQKWNYGKSRLNPARLHVEFDFQKGKKLLTWRNPRIEGQSIENIYI